MSNTHYEIYDNGGITFLVKNLGSSVMISKVIENIPECDCDDEDETIVEFKGVPYKRILLGDNYLEDDMYLQKGQMVGNSILLELEDGKYMYIGSEIYTFSLMEGDAIQSPYHSPVGNSCVPYPWAIGQNYTYLMLEKKCVENSVLDLSDEVYNQYWDNEKELADKIIDFKDVEMVHERVL
jgi:hypothetical protein